MPTKYNIKLNEWTPEDEKKLFDYMCTMNYCGQRKHPKKDFFNNRYRGYQISEKVKEFEFTDELKEARKKIEEEKRLERLREQAEIIDKNMDVPLYKIAKLLGYRDTSMAGHIVRSHIYKTLDEQCGTRPNIKLEDLPKTIQQYLMGVLLAGVTRDRHDHRTEHIRYAHFGPSSQERGYFANRLNNIIKESYPVFDFNNNPLARCILQVPASSAFDKIGAPELIHDRKVSKYIIDHLDEEGFMIWYLLAGNVNNNKCASGWSPSPAISFHSNGISNLSELITGLNTRLGLNMGMYTPPRLNVSRLMFYAKARNKLFQTWREMIRKNFSEDDATCRYLLAMDINTADSMKRPRWWTAKEEATLLLNRKKSLDELCELLPKRTKDGISTKLSNMNAKFSGYARTHNSE